MAQAAKKFRIKYPSVESFCREYDANLRYGGLFVPTVKPPSLHTILELILTVPELEDAFSVKGEVVMIRDSAAAESEGLKPGIAVQVIVGDQIRLEDLKAKLAQIEIYRTLLHLEAPPASPKAASPSPAPSPPAPTSPPASAAPDSAEPGPKITISKPPLESPPPAATSPPISAASDSAEPGPKITISKPPLESPPQSAAAPSPPPPPVHQAAPVKSASRDLLKDKAIDFLRQAIGEESVENRPLRQEIIAPPPPTERVRKTFSEDEKQRLEPVSQFVGILVKAMLRSGYYAPEHPESKKAKQGLFQSFRSALKDQAEIGLVSRLTHEATDILASGVLEEPVSLRSLFTAGAAEMFLPKLREYFERKGLISFSIKAGISDENFDTFVDIMSDPAVDKEDSSEVGHFLTEALARHNILEISTVFKDDMIKLGLKLPWRVEMAIQRLAKDLRTVPMFQNLSEEELTKLKSRIIEDILRPLRQPHMLKDMVVNCYLIAQHVEGLNAEELEQTLIQHFPMAILLPTSEYIFAEMKALKAELEQKPDSPLVQDRLNGIKRILKYISTRVIVEQVEGGEAFLENLFFQEVLTFEELPKEVQDRINTIRLAQAFAENPAYYTGKFSETRAPEDYQLFLRFWRRILPEILDNCDYPNLYFLCAALDQAKKRDPEQLKKFRGEIEDEIEFVWTGYYSNLKEKFLTEKKETRTSLDEVVILLGADGIKLMVQVMAESQDRWVRKHAIDALIRMGTPARKRIRAVLDDPAQPWALQRNALFILSQLALRPAADSTSTEAPDEGKDDQARFERFLRHSQPQLREEALAAVFRLRGPTAIPKLISAMEDADPRVRRRALACLALLPTLPPELVGPVLRKLRPEGDAVEEDGVKIQALKVLAQLGNVDVAEGEDVETVVNGLLDAGSGWTKKLLSRLRQETGESEAVKLASLETLGKIGTEKSLPLLERLAKSATGLFAAKIQEAQKQIELRTQK